MKYSLKAWAPLIILLAMGCSKMEDMEESSGATVSGTSLEQEMSIVAMGMSNELKEKRTRW